MTFREKVEIEHPDYIDENLFGGVVGCPSTYGYEPRDEKLCSPSKETCTKCWSRVIHEESREVKPIKGPLPEENPHILDSGNRTEFASGAVRDMREGKGRCDLLPLDVVATYSNNDVIIYTIAAFQVNGNEAVLYEVLKKFQLAYFNDRPTMLLEVAKHFEEGCKKYGENNWQKGIPTHVYVDSAVRHYLKFLRGDNDEPHDRAFCWNILCCIWTAKHMPELNTYAKKKEEPKKGKRKIINNYNELQEKRKQQVKVAPVVNTCVCCGGEIPEGGLLCPLCQADMGG